MKTRSRWKTAGLIAGVGCGSIIAIVVLCVVIAVVWARATVAQLGDTAPTEVQRTIPVGSSSGAVAAEATPKLAEAPPAPETAPRAAGSNAPLQLTVDLEEGDFTIRPGPAGSQVQIQGTYSPNLYEITEEHQTDGPSPRATIRFRSKAPAWARMLSGIGNNSRNRPVLTVQIPAGTPMDLTLRVSMGESHVDLGGLTLRALDLEASMGEHRIEFREPLTEGLRSLRVNASMGNVSIDKLGNARPQTIDAHGSMGNLTADLGGAWDPGSDVPVTVTHSMGQVRLNIPNTVRLDADISRSENQAKNTRTSDTDTRDPDAPRLRLRVSTSMGESHLVRY